MNQRLRKSFRHLSSAARVLVHGVPPPRSRAQARKSLTDLDLKEIVVECGLKWILQEMRDKAKTKDVPWIEPTPEQQSLMKAATRLAFETDRTIADTLPEILREASGVEEGRPA